eukprot:TRINITY_DN822_c0_g1_i1.p1 TRINITY_DN822_c0_g1~~TRINITY_DN822_c0_g1_i1.p1  ORF type:complete len:268 (-),score=50.75 TRINITY_DN822_c0_g1_i1:82-789(-)
MEAVKQGNATAGAKSKTHTVVVALKRAPHAELSAYQPKLFTLDEHVGMSIAGLTSDARVLARFTRTECMNHRYVFGTPLPVHELVVKIADKSQVATQLSHKRPFGVGLLVAGYDKNGPHLFQTCPSGQYYDFKAVAIGARSQSAKTYLERHFETFAELPVEKLVVHCLKAISTTCPDGVELNQSNTTVAIVGADRSFTIYDDDKVAHWIELFKAEGPVAPIPAAMETDEPEPQQE